MKNPDLPQKIHGAFKIKPLDWDESDEADTPFALYTIYKLAAEQGYFFSRSQYPYHDESGPFKTREEACAAAQRDFEERVLQCLDLETPCVLSLAARALAELHSPAWKRWPEQQAEKHSACCDTLWDALKRITQNNQKQFYG